LRSGWEPGLNFNSQQVSLLIRSFFTATNIPLVVVSEQRTSFPKASLFVCIVEPQAIEVCSSGEISTEELYAAAFERSYAI
jgi:hypothetical protein